MKIKDVWARIKVDTYMSKYRDKAKLDLDIAINNFKSKPISNIIVDILYSTTPIMISQEQGGFIQGRQIHDCIGLASEGINLLDTKVWYDNLAFKVDIMKAFDTLNWDFLFKALQQFEFNGVLHGFLLILVEFDKTVRSRPYYFV